MIAPDVLRSASQNLIATYLELGRASTGSELWEEPGFRACVGPLEHPICNFAADLRLDRHAALRLKEVAERRHCFSVYRLPTDEPPHSAVLLEDAGFHVSHHLAQMLWEPDKAIDAEPQLRAQGMSERRQVASFMAEQFFSKHAGRYRRGIVEATAAAERLQLCRVVREGRIRGAVMLFEHEGTLGIYNLCVDAPERRRGLGSAIIRSVQAEGYEKGAAVTLQCEASLVRWYRTLGFRQTGEVAVYGLSRFKDVDIMGL